MTRHLPSADRPDPQRVGSFDIRRVIGRGGMGVVYEGIAADGTRAAVKCVRAEEASGEALLRFQRESAIRLQHPNVVRVLEAGAAADGSPYIAFELLDGVSLRTRLSRGILPITEALDVAIQACRGVAAVHRVGIVHRDIKPGNLFICTDGTVKVLDFGVALLLSEDDRLTQGERRAIGTPSFLSPEQARGELDVDARADVWGLGVVMYEVLSGIRPFRRDGSLATMLAVVLDDPPWLADVARHVPDTLADVVKRCLMKRREDRYPSADALGAALETLDVSGAAAPIPSDMTTVTGAALSDAPSALTGASHGEKRVVSIVLARGVRDLAAVREAISRHGGLTVPILGSRAIGLFGGESWEGDEMVRAAKAALAARRAASRVAVASGRASVHGRRVGGAVLRKAEAGLAPAVGGVTVDAETARAIGDVFAVRHLEEGIYEITTARPAAGRPSESSTLMAQPTIGRDVELAQAERVVEDVLSEQKARALLFLGPPGIGKSRLLREIEQRLERAADPVCLLRARGEPLRRSTALSLFATAISGQLRARLGIDSDAEGPPPDTMREALLDLAEQAIEDEDDAVACAEFLGELLGVPMPESTTLRAARADPPLMADRLQLAVQDYLGALCETRPVVLVLEDLQWADGSSLDVLEALLDQLADAPFFVCGSARPEVDNVRRDLLSGRDAVRVEVRGLSRHDVSMLAQLLAGRRLDERLLDAVFERSGGNPLFVEQIVLALKDEGRLDAPTEDLPLPITVEAAVQSRLDHLAPEEKELCKRAAVFGRPFTAEEVERLGAIGAERSLGALRRRELVATRRRAGTRDRGPEYRFRSTLIADVAYRMIPDEQLQELHRAAATMLDARRDVERAEVAVHFEKAGEAKLAAERYAEAVLAAARRFDTATVIHCSERALELGAPEESRHGLHMARADALRFVGRHDEQSRELAAALAHAATDHQRARVLGEQAAWLTRRGKSDEAVSTGTAAVTMARSAGEDAEIARTLCIRAAAQLYAGRLDEARASLEDAARTATEGHPEVRALTADLRAQLASATGNLDERREAFRAAVDLYTDAGDVRRAANAELNLADADNRVGAYGEAAMALTACLEKCRRVGNRLSEGYALLNLGYATMMLGKVDEALSCLEQAAVLAESSRDARLSVFVDLYRARARLQRDGRLPPEDPESIALRAADIRMDAVSVLARTVAAEAALAAGDPARALASSSSAMQTLRQLGGIEEDEAEVYLTHAHALEASHRPEEARLVIEEGRARLRDVASRIQDVAFRDRFLRDVSAHRELMISP